MCLLNSLFSRFGPDFGYNITAHFSRDNFVLDFRDLPVQPQMH